MPFFCPDCKRWYADMTATCQQCGMIFDQSLKQPGVSPIFVPVLGERQSSPRPASTETQAVQHPKRPLLKDPENLLVGILLAVFLLGLERHAQRRGYMLLDAAAYMLGELLVISLFGVCLGWVIKQVRSLWQ